jgi:CelD/BcsL family acetyltransferase involved in cellulose biosynthesis
MIDVLVTSGSALPTTVGSSSVEVVSDFDAFVALEPEWNDAVEQARVSHPFLRHEWIRSWWNCFGIDRQFHILVARRGGAIAAIAPLLRESTRMYGVPVRRIGFLHNDHTPRTDIISAGHPAESCRAVWNALLSRGDSWDVLQLSQLPDDSVAGRAIPELAASDGYTVGIWRGGESPYLALDGDWSAYLNSRSAKFRQNLRNRLSRLSRMGEPALEVLRDPVSIARAFDDMWRLEDSGWKRNAGTAISSDATVRSFYSLLAKRGATSGWLRLLFLTVGGRRIAVSYGSSYRNRLLLFKTGYDPEYTTCSPFKLLTYFAIRHAFEEGMAEVDFLGDAEPWKLEWTTTTRRHDWVFVFSNSRRARLVYSLKFRWAPELRRWRG